MQRIFFLQFKRRLLVVLLILVMPFVADAMFKWKAHSETHKQKSATHSKLASGSHATKLYYYTNNQDPKTAGAEYPSHISSESGKGPGFGIASLILGFAAILFSVLFPPGGLLIACLLAAGAIACGAVGFNREGKGMAIAGFCIGIGVLVFTAIAVIVWLSFMGAW